MHQCIKFIYFRMALYMFRTVCSVHHQEFKTLHTVTGICQTDTAVCLLAGTASKQTDKCLLLYVQS